jgi:hypothetical protein
MENVPLVLERYIKKKAHFAKFIKMLPFIFIALSLSSVFLYHTTLKKSTSYMELYYPDLDVALDLKSDSSVQKTDSIIAGLNTIKVLVYRDSAILANNLYHFYKDVIPFIKSSKYRSYYNYLLLRAHENNIKYNLLLIAIYLMIFIFAEAAFVMMAIKEYLQDLLGLSEMDVIRSIDPASTFLGKKKE